MPREENGPERGGLLGPKPNRVGASAPPELPRLLISGPPRRKPTWWQLAFRGVGLAGLFLTATTIVVFFTSISLGNLASGIAALGFYGCALLVPLTGLLCLIYVLAWPTFEKSRIETFDWALLLVGVGALAVLWLGLLFLMSMACCP